MQVAATVSGATLFVDSRLCRRVVDLAADRARGAGDESPGRQLARSLEPVYASAADASERVARFESVYRRLFAEWGFEGQVSEALAEFPLLAQTIVSVWLKHAERGEAAGADLGGADLRQLGISLPASLCLEPEALRLYLRRELAAVEDVLDPDFGYSPGPLVPERPAAMENLARERLRLLWGTSVDGRLARGHEEYGRLRGERFREARAAYRSLPVDLPERLVERLWCGPRPRYGDLKLWARDNESLLAAFLPGVALPAGPFVPGSPCPLCGFPVTLLATAWEGPERQALASLVSGDFPSWRPESGACERCVEGYAVRAGRWL